jgi:hypothetical protein
VRYTSSIPSGCDSSPARKPHLEQPRELAALRSDTAFHTALRFLGIRSVSGDLPSDQILSFNLTDPI